jgi:hypothetical protein
MTIYDPTKDPSVKGGELTVNRTSVALTASDRRGRFPRTRTRASGPPRMAARRAAHGPLCGRQARLCYCRNQLEPFGPPLWLGLEPGRKFVLPLGLHFV